MSEHPHKRPAFEPAERLLQPVEYDPEMRRPLSTVAGAALILLRQLVGVVVLVGFAIGWESILDALASVSEFDPPAADDNDVVLWFVIAAGGTILAINSVLAILVYLGRNWPRVIVMSFTVLSISTVFVAWWVQGQEITINGALVSVGLDILILLALSSRSAAAYARRNERR
ncbi:hypothetical protein GCM10022200_23150 [Microbacterium awajiense]|uniref:Integral membrane protein n=1 Tax=Microbacterium awajiense TaxID=415214 RepID=A0ABP7ARP4_9MICO